MPARQHPIDLSARMAVCDANYIRVLKLLPALTLGACRHFALPPLGAVDSPPLVQRVEMDVVERFTYTSTVRLSLHLQGEAQPWYRPPELLVRLYHDASTAEVVSYQDERNLRVLYRDDEIPRYHPDEKEQINLFLADWLILCLDAGLGQAAAPAADAPALLPSS